ncbi:glycosyltransferase family 2 protein [Limisalsivibrio acetivorans]|uniref:glycosyltransferase family 2 protein n=1 Tax=Limisalsivibrio acetivorans TaxID=1304888 RepID=UPI0003B78FDB|nr:glycosyltransferase family 2 protein [Limisalsivibrio acetivorans]
MSSNLPLSVSIISFNEEDNIGRTLESVMGFAHEIIVVDSHSTDKTVEIAEAFGAKVYDEDWKGHVKQKNSAIEKCTQEWILSLDCDEVVTPELENSIRETVASGEKDGYIMNRRTFYAGKMLAHSWQPDNKLRLVKRSANPRWGGYDPHDVLEIEGTKGKLNGDLIHYSYRDINDHFQRLLKYAKTAAMSYHKNGRRFSMFRLIFNPPAAFIKKYIIRGGFLDGFHGLLVAVSSFIYVFLKYVFLWEIERNEG